MYLKCIQIGKEEFFLNLKWTVFDQIFQIKRYKQIYFLFCEYVFKEPGCNLVSVLSLTRIESCNINQINYQSIISQINH